MPILVSCVCGKKMSVRDELAGKRVKCPKCQKVIPVPVPEVEPEVVEEEVPQEAEEDNSAEAAPVRKAIPQKRPRENTRASRESRSREKPKSSFLKMAAIFIFLCVTGVVIYAVATGKSIDDVKNSAASAVGNATGGLLSDHISAVKGGILELNKALTVGDAFDKYSHWKSKKGWRDFQTANGISVVEFSATAISNEQEGEVKLHVFHFVVNKDGTFGFSGYYSGSVSKDRPAKNVLLDNSTEINPGIAQVLGGSGNFSLDALVKVYKNEKL